MSPETTSEQNPAENANCPIKKKLHSPTIRLTLTLREPDEENCSVFNYKSLIAVAERKRLREKEKNQLNGSRDEKEEDEGEVKRIAQHFLEKYGTTSTKKKIKKAPKFYNYTELAQGYDENDSFIDNSEAFDEAIPDEMETFHGGYYVNVGQLEFKKVEKNDENSDDEIGVVGKRKNCILKSDDSGSDEETVKSDEDESKTEDEEGDAATKKLPEETDHEETEIETVENTPSVEVVKLPVVKDKLNSTIRVNGDIVKQRKKYKKRSLDNDDAVMDDLPKAKKKAITVKSLLEEKRIVENGDIITITTAKSAENVSNSINDAIESVISAARHEDSRDSTSSSSDAKSIDSRTSEETEKENYPDAMEGVELAGSVCGVANTVVKEQVTLPDNLGAEVLELVSQIKNSAQNSESGARSFFKSSVNSKLLNLEAKVRSLKSAARHSLYEYLASFLPCSKDTLMKRAKKLLIEEEERHIIEPYNKLKAVIERIKPTILDNYTAACQQFADENPHLYWEIHKYYWNVNDVKNGDTDEKKNLLSKMPPKRFMWTDEMRGHLRELVSCRLKCFQMLKPRKESADDYIQKFLETKVVPLWPPGWMDTSILLKEIHLTSLTSKTKKNSLLTTGSSATTSTIKKSYSSVPSMSNISSTSMAATDYNFITNSLALQSLAMQYPPTQSEVSYSTAPSASIPYRPDLNMMAAALPSQPVSMDILCRIALGDTSYTTAAASHSTTKSTSPPKKQTSPSPSYPAQRSTTPVGQRSAALLSSAASHDKKKPSDPSMSKSNDMFKIDSLINTAKTKKEPHMLNHISQYNKHYSHKTDKRLKENNVPSRKSGSHSTSSASHTAGSNGTSKHNNAAGGSLSSKNGPSGESSKRTRDLVLDLSPNKIKVESRLDDVHSQPELQSSRTEVSGTTSNSGSVTAKDHNYWSAATCQEEVEVKKEEMHCEVQAQIKVPFTSPEAIVSSQSGSKPTHISRKQRLLQETSKAIGQEPIRKSPARDFGNSIVLESTMAVSACHSLPTVPGGNKDREAYSISKLMAGKSDKSASNKEESKSSMSKNDKHSLEENTKTADIINKIIDDSFKAKAAAPALPHFNSKFEISRVEPEVKSEDRVISPAEISDSKLRPSSRDSSHSSTSSLNTERRTPNSDRADIDAATDVIKDLLALNQSIPRRMDLESKKHNDLNYSNGSLLSQSSLHSSDKNKSANLPRMNLSGFQNEFFKHIYNKVDNNDSYTNNSKSQDNCFTSELPSLETEPFSTFNLVNTPPSVKQGNSTVFNYQQSVIMPPASTRWYSPESKS